MKKEIGTLCEEVMKSPEFARSMMVATTPLTNSFRTTIAPYVVRTSIAGILLISIGLSTLCFQVLIFRELRRNSKLV